MGATSRTGCECERLNGFSQPTRPRMRRLQGIGRSDGHGGCGGELHGRSPGRRSEQGQRIWARVREWTPCRRPGRCLQRGGGARGECVKPRVAVSAGFVIDELSEPLADRKRAALPVPWTRPSRHHRRAASAWAIARPSELTAESSVAS